VTIERLDQRFGVAPSADWPEPPARGFAAPICNADGQVQALLVGGLSPRLALDDPYKKFLHLVCAQLSILLAAAGAQEAWRVRSEEV
jgi:hypothetical protein